MQCGLHLYTVRDRCLDPWERSFFGITETASDSRGHRGRPPMRPSPAGGLGRHGWNQQRTMQSAAILSYRTEHTVLLFFVAERFKAQHKTDKPSDHLPNMRGCTGRKNNTKWHSRFQTHLSVINVQRVKMFTACRLRTTSCGALKLLWWANYCISVSAGHFVQQTLFVLNYDA